MKIIKICFLFFLASACEFYTIQNNYPDNITAGYVVMTPLQCVEFFDFPVIGDFPIRFRYKNHQLISDKEYSANHYLITETGEIKEQEEPCEIEPVGQPPVSLPETPVSAPAESPETESLSGPVGETASLETESLSGPAGETASLEPEPESAGGNTGETQVSEPQEAQESQESQNGETPYP